MSEKFLCDDNNLFLDDLSVQNNLFRYIKNSRRRELKKFIFIFRSTHGAIRKRIEFWFMDLERFAVVYILNRALDR